jgi:hypothetical protein
MLYPHVQIKYAIKKCPNILKKVNVIKLVENNIFFVAD